MLKIKFENLLVILVLSLIVGYDVIMTSVLNKTLPQLPTILLIGVVLVLSLRFLFIKNFSILFIVSGILLIVTSLCVFLQTGATNFLLYSLLILLLYDVDVDVILKNLCVCCWFNCHRYILTFINRSSTKFTICSS